MGYPVLRLNVLPGLYVILECIYIRISVNLLFSIVNYIPFISIGGIVYIITLSVIISFFPFPEAVLYKCE